MFDCLYEAPVLTSHNPFAEKNNLDGTLPEEIRLLDSMESFGVYWNELSGTIPSGIVEWSELRLLDLERNKFVGPAFPEKLSQWSHLESYQISNNKLNGPMLTDFYALPELRSLWIAGNSITGTLPKSLMYSSKLGTCNSSRMLNGV